MPAHAMETRLSFFPQSGFEVVRFDASGPASLAVAGRTDAGEPKLALLRLRAGQIERREVSLPDNAIAVDTGGAGAGGDALFVLCADRVLRLNAFDGGFETVAVTTSMYRGRSFAELTSAIDFARDIDADDRAELLVQDFDRLHVFSGVAFEPAGSPALPAGRRGFDRAATYRPARVAIAASEDANALFSIRGDELLTFARAGGRYPAQPAAAPLQLGLSDERELEAFYNGYDSIDQSAITLREPELMIDLNGDDLADLVTLETQSSGVFDKSSTYRVHLARLDDGRLRFAATPDATLSSRGFQFGLRAQPLDDERAALISPGFRIGVRAIISALFTRSVTLSIAIYAPDAEGRLPSEPSTVVKSKIRFDFDSGSAEFPTIAFGDVDGDGQKDLLLKRKGRTLEWRRSLGGGRFSEAGTDIDFLAPADGSAVIAADLDGDGRVEIIAKFARADGEEMQRVVRVAQVAVD